MNTAGEAEARDITQLMQTAFGISSQEGAKSYITGNVIEVIKGGYLGRNGHIAIGTPDIDAAVAYLEERDCASTRRQRNGTRTGKRSSIWTMSSQALRCIWSERN